MKRLDAVGESVRRWWRRGWSFARGVPEGLRLYARGLHLVGSTAPVALAVVLVLGAALPLLPVLQTWLVKLVVDALTRAVRGVQGQEEAAVVLAILYALTLVLPEALRPLQRAQAARLSDRTVAAVDRRLMQTGRQLVDLVRIERPAFGDELQLLQNSIFGVSNLTRNVPEAVGLPLQLGGLLLLLGRLHPLLPLALVGAAIPSLIFRTP